LKTAIDQVRQVGEEVSRRRLVELAESHDATLSGILRPKQRHRLKQLAIQWRGIFALKDPEIVRTLQLTSEQRKSIRQLEREIFGHSFGFPGLGREPGERRPPFLTRSASIAKVMELLTPEQVLKWKELTGAPFADVDLWNPPGFRQPGDNRGPPRKPRPQPEASPFGTPPS